MSLRVSRCHRLNPFWWHTCCALFLGLSQVVFLGGMLLLSPTAAHAQKSAGSAAEELSFRTTSLPVPRQMHGTAVVGDYIFVLGGALDPLGYSADVSYSHISPDGLLGDWQKTTPLPEPRVYIGNTTVVHGSTIYIVGGNVHSPGNPPADPVAADKLDNYAASNALYATVGADGRLSNWQKSGDFPGPPTLAGAAFATATHLYVAGGNSGSGAIANVYRAPFRADGSLGVWVDCTPMPRGLWFLGGALLGDQILVWGGRDAERTLRSESYSSRIQPDGSLGPWVTEAPLPRAFSHMTALGYQNFAVSFGGVDAKKKAVKEVYFAMKTDTGITEWSSILASLPLSRYGAAAYDARRGIVYLPGGRLGPESSSPLLADVFGFHVYTGDRDSAPPPTSTSSRGTAVAATPSGGGAAAGGTKAVVGWQFNFTEALAISRKLQRPLFVVVGSSKVPASTKVWATVIQDPAVLAKIAAGYVPVVCDISKDRGPALTLGVFRVPAVATVTPEGTVSRRLSGDDLTVAGILALP